MKAISITQPGIEYLQVQDQPKPLPKQGQVLINVKAFSLNYLDLFVTNGIDQLGLPLPHVPGSDAAGVVEAVGEGVTRFKPGDRVTTHYIQSWHTGEAQPHDTRARLGIAQPGVFAEFVTLDAQNVVATPGYLTDEEAATLPIAALTAWTGLFDHGGLKPGQTLLVQGTGGVSLFALQFAKAAGASVIITSSSDQKLARAKALGADYLINYTANPNWAEQVRALTNGIGADLTLDVVGPATITQSIKAVKTGGTVALVGLLSGVNLEFDVLSVIDGRVTLKGFSVASRDSFEAMNRALAITKIKPVIDRVFPADQIKDALNFLASGQHFGKIVLTF